MRYITWIVILCSSVCAQAADWRHAGFNDAYYDADSVKREGDIGTITIKTLGGTSRISFDCKRELSVSFGERTESYPLNETTQVFYKLACKRKWEFWK